jgi:hypothetical protein
MPTYFGLPLNIDEIIRILNISTILDNAFELIMNKQHNKNRQLHDYDIEQFKIHEIRKYIKSRTKLDLFVTDKGQYILGYKIIQISDVWNNFINADQLIELLKQFKVDFEEDMLTLNAELFHVELERMENDNIYVNYPQPFVIEWNS